MIATRFSIAALFVLSAFGCRQVLSIDDGRTLLAADSGTDAPDAGDDGGAEAGGGSGRCADIQPAPQFCADFDDGPVTGRWDNAGATPDPYVTGGGSILRDDVNFRSKPYGAAVSVPVLLAPSMASVALVKSFSTPPSNLLVDFDLRIDTEDFREKGQAVMLLSLTFPVGQLTIGRSAAGLSLATYDESTQDEAASTEPLPVGTWKRVSLIMVDRGAGSGELSLQVDGVLAAKLPLSAKLGGKGTTYLGFGVVGAVGNMGAFRATLDNVSFTSDATLRR